MLALSFRSRDGLKVTDLGDGALQVFDPQSGSDPVLDISVVDGIAIWRPGQAEIIPSRGAAGRMPYGENSAMAMVNDDFFRVLVGGKSVKIRYRPYDSKIWVVLSEGLVRTFGWLNIFPGLAASALLIGLLGLAGLYYGGGESTEPKMRAALERAAAGLEEVER